MHPQTQGKIERCHQTLKNRVLLENYFFEGEHEAAIAAFTGPVAYSCRSKCSFRPPGVRRPRGFSLPMRNVGGVGYRSR